MAPCGMPSRPISTVDTSNSVRGSKRAPPNASVEVPRLATRKSALCHRSGRVMQASGKRQARGLAGPGAHPRSPGRRREAHRQVNTGARPATLERQQIGDVGAGGVEAAQFAGRRREQHGDAEAVTPTSTRLSSSRAGSTASSSGERLRMAIAGRAVNVMPTPSARIKIGARSRGREVRGWLRGSRPATGVQRRGGWGWTPGDRARVLSARGCGVCGQPALSARGVPRSKSFWRHDMATLRTRM